MEAQISFFLLLMAFPGSLIKWTWFIFWQKRICNSDICISTSPLSHNLPMLKCIIDVCPIMYINRKRNSRNAKLNSSKCNWPFHRCDRIVGVLYMYCKRRMPFTTSQKSIFGDLLISLAYAFQKHLSGIIQTFKFYTWW